MAREPKPSRLKKELGLFDVYAIATGAMFSSGFFLLPGLAAAKAGPAVVLAYLLAGILILPSMLSAAELSTALPRAGGAYYFLDRALGPMFGTIGGLGTFLALTLKTAFALVGIGAYASLYFELPTKYVAIALTVVFVVINVIGAKESSGLQRALVTVLLVVLAYFMAVGVFDLIAHQPAEVTRGRFGPFMPHGIAGLLSTVGFVFVSYAGLTKVASVAEEVKNPERNIPLGMMLSLASTSLVYVVGVFVVVALLEPDALYSDLTPIATATEAISTGFPAAVAVPLIVVAALAAFASTGNAGIMSASRYPLAMARDRLLPGVFAKLGRFKTPTRALMATGALMALFIVVLDEEGIAKLASAFQLFIFILLNFAVIVMRESRIPSYDPGYRSPLYPWMQIAGMVVSAVLIASMGWLASAFTLGVVVACLVWYYQYAREHVIRDGAIYHWFSRLGQRRYDDLDREFRGILKEKGLREDDPFDETIARAQVIEASSTMAFEDVVHEAAAMFARRLPVTADRIEQGFLDGTRTGATPCSGGAALPHLHVPGIDEAEIVLARSLKGMHIDVGDSFGDAHRVDEPVHAIFFLISPEGDPGQHLRMLAHIANVIDNADFLNRWLAAGSIAHIKEVLLRDAHYLTIRVHSLDRTADLVGQRIRDLDLPDPCLVAVIRRGDRMVVPRGDTVLEDGDRITVIGTPGVLEELTSRYVPID